ncbi:MAG: hypothetical protein R3D59_04610 [Paracoccaceae bacterium]
MTRSITASPSRTALAATLAAALAIPTFTPAPAQAGDTGDAIAAAAFLGLVAAAVLATSHSAPAHPGGWAVEPTPVPQRPLPVDCRFDIKDGPDRGTWFSRSCLFSHYPSWPSLPGSCAERVALGYGHYGVVAYGAQCLIRNGVVVAERGHGGNGHGDRH